MNRADKVAFIHYAKAAGRYVGYYLRSHVFGNGMADPAEQEFKIFNSWEVPYSLGRDWTEAELLQLANNRFPGQYPTPDEILTHHRCWAHDYLSKQYVHNHHHSWTNKTICEFSRNGWVMFMFIRDPADLLCSLWTWAHNESVGRGHSVLRPERLVDLSLDEFIREIIETPELHVFYALPSYLNHIDYVAEFTDNNFRCLLQMVDPGHQYEPERIASSYRHASGNPGYADYRQRGVVSDETHELLSDDPEVRRVRELIANQA